MKSIDQFSTVQRKKTYKDPQPYGKSNSRYYDNFSSLSCSTRKEGRRKKKDNKLQLISYVRFESDTRHIFIPRSTGSKLIFIVRTEEKERRGKDSTNQIEPSSRYSSRLYIQEHACAALLTLLHPSVSDPIASRITRYHLATTDRYFSFSFTSPLKICFFYVYTHRVGRN